ncbi:hypothetical protein DFJ73DRAFT_799624 [Zopfochytrium polystomum]|nr:hypothetical protein DFJ73DRAFT_799624 [Zopfochytrium polystomum]
MQGSTSTANTASGIRSSNVSGSSTSVSPGASSVSYTSLGNGVSVPATNSASPPRRSGPGPAPPVLVHSSPTAAAAAAYYSNSTAGGRRRSSVTSLTALTPTAYNANLTNGNSSFAYPPGNGIPSNSVTQSSPPSSQTSPISGDSRTLRKRVFGDRKIPFAAIITLEIFLCCILVAGTLMSISFVTYNKSTNDCLGESESSKVSLTSKIQSSVMKVISAKIDSIVAQPVSFVQEALRLSTQAIINLNNYDALWKYFYFQIKNQNTVVIVYYGDDSFGDYVGIETIDPNNTALGHYAEFRDVRGASGGVSRCPESCSQKNINWTDLNYFNTAEVGSSVVLTDRVTSRQYSTKDRIWYKLASNITTTTPVWTPPYVFANGQDVGITVALPVSDTTGKLQGVLAADITLTELRIQLELIKADLTPSAFILIFTTDGTLVGTSVANETLAVGTFNETLNSTVYREKHTNELTDPISHHVVDYLIGEFGSIGNISANGTYQLPRTEVIPALLFSYAKKLIGTPGYPNITLILVAGAQSSDYTAEIDLTRENIKHALIGYNTWMVASAAIVAVFFMLLTIPMTLMWVGRPMRKLATNMERVAKYDFSVLKGTDRNKRSRITEVWMIQNAYWQMVNRFATGIAENRKLMFRGAATA